MRILLITQWFDPEPSFKGLLFARKLQEAGHVVEVLTGFPNYPGGKVYHGYKIKAYQRDVIDCIVVHRVALYPSHDQSSAKRLLNYASFAATASIAAMLVRCPDVVYVYHPPASVGATALLLHWLRGVPFVYDIQDLWPDTLSATGMLSNALALKLVDQWMKLIYQQSNRITVLSNGFRDRLIEIGVPAHKLTVIPNWTDEAQIQLTTDSLETARVLGLDGKFTIVFAGTMGKAQALDTVINAAKILKETDPNIHFVLIGGGIEVERLKTIAISLPNVTFLPRRPLAEIGEILSMSDALLVHLKDDPLFTITIPSKTQAYLLAGKPILMGVRGDAAQMIEEAGAGLSFTPEQPESLATAAKNLSQLSNEELEYMGEAGKRYYEQHLSLDHGAKLFLSLLEKASFARKTGRSGQVFLAAIGSILIIQTLIQRRAK